MDQPDDSGYGVGVLMFCIGAVVELLTEPLVIFGQAHQYVTTKVGGWGNVVSHIVMFLLTKVLVEGVSQLCRCGFTVVMAMWFPQWGMTALSAANVRTIPLHANYPVFHFSAILLNHLLFPLLFLFLLPFLS